MNSNTLKLTPGGLNIWQFLVPFILILPPGQSTADHNMSNSLQNSPISFNEVIVGDDVLLPCDVSPPVSNDAPILVLFYREENKTPIFSLDSRGSSLSSGIHWSAESLLSRAYMKTLSNQQGLFIKKIVLEDAGLYRCRVDFKASPTRNSRVELRVIEPPRRISVTSSWQGDRMTKDVIGPYPVGEEIILSCQVIGGSPPPHVTWWHEGSLLDDISEVRSGGVTRNSLHLPKLSRSDLLKILTCHASNSNLTSPLRKAVTIDLAYPPSAIRISSTSAIEGSNPTDQLTIPRTITCPEGEKCPLECQVDGSRPPPIVTWKTSDRTLESEFQTISSPPGVKGSGDSSDKSSSFHSTLMLTANSSDNGAIVSCRATSPALRSQAIEDSVQLNVLYKPQLKLKVKNDLDLKNVEENEDIEFECAVNANPHVSEIQWTRNWIPLVHNSSSGVYISSTGLTLGIKKITSKLSGQYACAAANNRGSGTSNVIPLFVKFSPKCSTDQIKSVGIGKSESANVTCKVDAHPPATIFRWSFNTSDEMIDIPFDQQIERNDSSNTIRYSPRSPFDYGHLVCWATNSVGTMKIPCVVNILPIDKPEGVRGCKISSNGSRPNSLVSVSCHPGWDGGLTQTFTLEVRKAAHSHARSLSALQHSKDPVFQLRNLEPSEEYLFTITSANPRGTSPSVTLSYRTPEEVIAGLTNKHSNPENSFFKLMPFLAIFCAIVVVLTTCVSIMACIAKTRAAERASSAKSAKEAMAEPNIDSRKASAAHSMPPDRGKMEDLEEDDVIVKSPDRYCAVHGLDRQENEYVSYKHYFNNVRDDLETQHLLKSSIGGSLGMDNQYNLICSQSQDSSGNYCFERPSLKDCVSEYALKCVQQRHSDGSCGGLAPLASVDSLSGFSTISNHSSTNSKKLETSSQRSFPAIPEALSPCEDCSDNSSFFQQRTNYGVASTSTGMTLDYPSMRSPSTSGNTLIEPYNSEYATLHYSQSQQPPCSNATYQPISKSKSTTLSSGPPFEGVPQYNITLPPVSPYSYTIPSLPPPLADCHPIFNGGSLKQTIVHSDSSPWDGYRPVRRMSRESSV